MGGTRQLTLDYHQGDNPGHYLARVPRSKVRVRKLGDKHNEHKLTDMLTQRTGALLQGDVRREGPSLPILRTALRNLPITSTSCVADQGAQSRQTSFTILNPHLPEPSVVLNRSGFERRGRIDDDHGPGAHISRSVRNFSPKGKTFSYVKHAVELAFPNTVSWIYVCDTSSPTI